MMRSLPESMQFLVVRRRDKEKVHEWLRRMVPDLHIGAGTELTVRETQEAGSPISNLFREGRIAVTLLLWVLNFSNMLCIFFLANWLPTVMMEAGHTPAQAVLAGTVMWSGGIFGNLLLGRFVDRRGFGPVLTISFLVAAFAVGMIGQVYASLQLAFCAIFLSGFCVLGNQTALNALAATYYSTSMRSTGMGWALGVGRLGSILGPVVGGGLMALKWSNGELFVAAALPAIVAVSATVALHCLGSLQRLARGAGAAH
jgi:AAHS family 4-hydroxybenzoate transporter-like MFS transporter